MPLAGQFLTGKDLYDLRDANIFWVGYDPQSDSPPPLRHGHFYTDGEFSAGYPDTEDDEETLLIWDRQDHNQILYIMNEWLERIAWYTSPQMEDDWKKFQRSTWEARGDKVPGSIAIDGKAMNYLRTFMKPLALKVKAKAVKVGATDHHLD